MMHRVPGRTRRTIVTSSLVLVAFTVAACGGGGGGGGGSTPTTPTTPADPIATSSVSIQSSAFNPADIVVAPSTSVTWTNQDGIAHNVTFTNAAITSITDFTSGSKSTTMPSTPGTYSYRCTIHSGMIGSIKVQ